jgi:3-hydroxybutyryl-CoA dehydratase
MSADAVAGASLEPWVLESVSAERMAELADVLRDPNPIHLDPAVVRRLGMGERVVNQGPANCSYVVNMLRAAFPGGVIRSLSFRLLGNVFAGDRVVAGGTIEGRDGELVRCAVWLDVTGGARVVEGTATVALPVR